MSARRIDEQVIISIKGPYLCSVFQTQMTETEH